MADSVASLPISLDLELSTFNKKLLQAQKSMGNILSDIPERISPKGRFRGMSSGDFIKASTYRDRMKGWAKTFQEAPEKEKFNLVNSALNDIRKSYPASTPSQVTKTFESMFKDVGVDIPKSVKPQADKWKKQENDRIAREKKELKLNEKQTQDVSNISNMLFKGVLGFGAKLTPYAIATKAATSAIRGLNNIYSTRAVYGNDYSRSSEAAASSMAGGAGEKFYKESYAQYADFKPMMEMGIVNTDMIKRVAIATRKNPEILTKLMKGDTNGFINSVMDLATTMKDPNEARAMFSVLGMPVEGAMQIWKKNRAANANLYGSMSEVMDEKGMEHSWEYTSEALDTAVSVFNTGFNALSAIVGSIGNTTKKGNANNSAGKVEIQEVNIEVNSSEEAAKTVENLDKISRIGIIKNYKTKTN